MPVDDRDVTPEEEAATRAIVARQRAHADAYRSQLSPEAQARIKAKGEEYRRKYMADPNVGGSPLRKIKTLEMHRAEQGTTARGGRPKTLWRLHPREVLRRYDEGTDTLAALAEEAQVSVTTVRRRFQAAGYFPMPQLASEAQVSARGDEIDIAGDNMLHASEVSRFLQREGWPGSVRSQVRRFCGEFGMHPGVATLLAAQVEEFRAGGWAVFEELPEQGTDEGIRPNSVEAAPTRPGQRRRWTRTRRPGPARAQSQISVERMEELYVREFRTLEQVAQAAGLSITTVRRRLLAAGVEMRATSTHRRLGDD